MRRWLILAALLLVPVAGQAQTIEYYGLDAIGSVRVVFDANGNVLSRADYAPFGEPLFPATGKQQQVYAGLFAEGEAGFDYAEARMYQPRTGRFNTVDPVYAGLFQPQAWNRYAYSLSAPLLFADPTGLDPIRIGTKGCFDFPANNAAHAYACGSDFVSPDLNTIFFSTPRERGRQRRDPTDRRGRSGPNGPGDPSPPGDPNPPPPDPPDPGDDGGWTDWIPRICGGGGFGYSGFALGPKNFGGEILGLVQYDTTSGGSHGGLLGGRAGHYVGGFETMRTWNDWQEHNSPIGLGGIELPGASRRFGKSIDIDSTDFGGLAQYESGTVSLGGYGGLTLGSGRAFGGGFYITLSWSECR